MADLFFGLPNDGDFRLSTLFDMSCPAVEKKNGVRKEGQMLKHILEQQSTC